MMNIDWRSAARHYLQVVAFCAVIAVLTTLIWPRRMYLIQFGHALTIGSIIWAVIEFGRYRVDPAHCHTASTGGHGWPKGWRGLLLTAIGIGCGFVFGSPLAEMMFGDGVAQSSRDSRIGLAITVVAGIVASFYFHARGKAAELLAQKTAAERDASEATLKLLETQLEPHMLFNTLANLRALIEADPPRAVAMLDRLNSYLRVTLTGSRALAHPLSDEFDRLADYLELMSIRMGDRLRYTLDLPRELRDVPVPPLLLQPLVENAIRHGLEPKVEGGEIVVRARRESRSDGGRLVIEVNDSGVGIDSQAMASAGEGGGFGLAQVRERLASTYGARGAIELIAGCARGTGVLVIFPL